MKLPLLFLSTLAILVVAKESPAPETSVKPGINQNFLDPNLKVDEWLQKFEVESREGIGSRFVVRLPLSTSADIELPDTIPQTRSA